MHQKDQIMKIITIKKHIIIPSLIVLKNIFPFTMPFFNEFNKQFYQPNHCKIWFKKNLQKLQCPWKRILQNAQMCYFVGVGLNWRQTTFRETVHREIQRHELIQIPTNYTYWPNWQGKWHTLTPMAYLKYLLAGWYFPIR